MWGVALKLALECVEKLKEKVNDVQELEQRSTEALMLLTKRYVPQSLQETTFTSYGFQCHFHSTFLGFHRKDRTEDSS
jgi:hypothetical protein